MADNTFRTATLTRGLGLAVDLDGAEIDGSVGRGWVDLTAGHHLDSDVVRITAPDLRAAQRQTARIRTDTTGPGHSGQAAVVWVDLEAMTAAHASAARARLKHHDASEGVPLRPESLRYVGTPTGLAGLIGDIFAADVADGVTLRPLSAQTLRDFCDLTLPQLQRFAPAISTTQLELIYPRRVTHSAPLARGPSQVPALVPCRLTSLSREEY